MIRWVLFSAGLGLLVAAGILAAGCYDTSHSTPPCSVNAHQEGCPDWPHDMRRPDGGR